MFPVHCGVTSTCMRLTHSYIHVLGPSLGYPSATDEAWY